jgi:hypothetical protein
MLTFIRSSGCVQQAAIALAIPPKYHLPILFVLPTDMTDINEKYSKLGFESSIFKQAIRSETTARILCHFSKTGHLREITKGCLLD